MEKLISLDILIISETLNSTSFFDTFSQNVSVSFNDVWRNWFWSKNRKSLKPLILLAFRTLFYKKLVFLLMVYNEKCKCGILEITHIVWMIIFCVVHKYWTKIFLKFNLLWKMSHEVPLILDHFFAHILWTTIF